MNLGSKIPVPEVDELRLARIEREVVNKVAGQSAEAPVTRFAWGKFAVGAVAVAGVVLAIALNLRGASAPAGGTATDPLPTRLATGPGESDQLLLGDAIVDVEENTDIAVQRFADGRTLIHLEKGFVHCEVKPRKNRPTFEVRAGDVNVAVVGTAFDVDRDLTVQVTVQRGIVSVTTSHETMRLHAGESWRGSPDRHRTLASLLEQETAVPDSGLAAVQDAGIATSDAGTKVATRNGSRDRRDASTRDNGRNGKNRNGKNRNGTNKTVPLADVLKNAKPIRPVVQPSHGEEARKLLSVAASNPSKAAKALEALGATSTGHEASFALYSRAYLLFFKLGKRSEVVRAATQYDRRFPRGREAEDMLWLRVRASCDDENYSSSCRSAAHTYRRRYPRGVFQALASRIIRSKKTE